jgi:hypothetical protein
MRRQFARGWKRPQPGQMNKLEARYGLELERRLRAEEILFYKFEGVKLRLADNTFYTPDFFVQTADGTLECHETKGFMMDDANVKIKVAASTFPFRFLLIKWVRGQWEVTEK